MPGFGIFLPVARHWPGTTEHNRCRRQITETTNNSNLFMKNRRIFRVFGFAVGILIGGRLHASDRELVDRYYTMEYPADRLVLKANETAIIDGTIGFDVTYNWMNILYKQGTNLPVNLYVPLGLGLGILTDPDPIMPLPG